MSHMAHFGELSKTFLEFFHFQFVDHFLGQQIVNTDKSKDGSVEQITARANCSAHQLPCMSMVMESRSWALECW